MSTPHATKPTPTSTPLNERRFVSGLELRENGEGKLPTITGYAARFNSKSVVMWDFREIIKPGAFAQSLTRGDDVRALVDHDASRIIGRRSAKTLTVVEDEKGLRTEIMVPDTQVGRDIVTSIRRGDVSGMSFGFRAVKTNWTIDPETPGMDLRELLQVDLFDVSPVTFPAYPETEVSVRSFYEAERRAARAPSELEVRRLNTRLRTAELV